MRTSLAILSMLCCACGKWSFVEDKNIPLRPTLGGPEAASTHLVASTDVSADGRVEITAKLEAGECTRMSTPHFENVRVERYDIDSKRRPHYGLLAGGTTWLVLGTGLAVAGLLIPEKDPSDPMAGSTHSLKIFFQIFGGSFAVAGATLLGFGIREASRNHSTRNTPKGKHDGEPARVASTTCPTLPKLDSIRVVTGWGEQLETTLKNGKGTLAVDWKALAARDLEASLSELDPHALVALAGAWKLSAGSTESAWKPTDAEVVRFQTMYGTERKTLWATKSEKIRQAKAEKRKQTGPPSFSVVSATSEYEVVPAGTPTKITVRVKNPGPGPADGATLAISGPGIPEVRTDVGALAVDATADREVTITVPANHPGGEIKLAARFTDPGAPQSITTSFTLTAAKQLAGAPKLVIEKLEGKGLRAGMRGELRLTVRNEGASNAYGATISMTSPKTPVLDALKHRIPYVKVGTTLDVTIPIEFPRLLDDPDPTGLVSANVPGGSARCGGALADCYAKLSIGPAPVPVLVPACEITAGVSQSKDKRSIANAGAALDLRCKIENKGEEVAHLKITAGIDKPATKQPDLDLAAGASTSITFQIPVPRDSVAASDHDVVISLVASHAVPVERRLSFRIGRVALCAPNSLDKTEYRRKTDELRKSRDAGEITQKDYEDADKELLGCVKK